jgi:hypothetical protein
MEPRNKMRALDFRQHEIGNDGYTIGGLGGISYLGRRGLRAC